MSRFVDLNFTYVTTEIAFGAAEAGTRSYMTCKGGEIAAWEYSHTDDSGNILINIFNATTGIDVPVATVYVMAGNDIFWGLFSSGAIPSKPITDANCVYYRVDY